MMQVELTVAASIAAALFPLLINIANCYRAILNDAKIISLDPVLRSPIEVLYAYPGEPASRQHKPGQIRTYDCFYFLLVVDTKDSAGNVISCTRMYRVRS